MKTMIDRRIDRMLKISTGLAVLFFLLSILVGASMHISGAAIIVFPMLFLLEGTLIAAVLLYYCSAEKKKIHDAELRIHSFMDGNLYSRIDSNEEGILPRFFEEINHMAISLHTHMEREKENKEFLKNTIADISHQLKTPLAAIQMYLEIMEGEVASLKTAKEGQAHHNVGVYEASEMDASVEECFITIEDFLAKSEHSIDRMENLIQMLLKITRLDAGVIDFKRECIRTADLIMQIQEEFAVRCQKEDKVLDLVMDDESSLVCDILWTREALFNIVKNALDHMCAGNKVEIRYEESAIFTSIIISDNGEGIHEEDIHNIFKRFYRSCYSKPSQGVGLGLSLAKSVIEAQGGSISVESKYGEGSRFKIDFRKFE